MIYPGFSTSPNMQSPVLPVSSDIQPNMLFQKSKPECTRNSLVETSTKNMFNMTPSTLVMGTIDCSVQTARSLSDFGLICHHTIPNVQHVTPEHIFGLPKSVVRRQNFNEVLPQRRVTFNKDLSIIPGYATTKYDRRNPDFKSTDKHLKMYRSLMNFKIREMISHKESVCNINRHLIKADAEQLKIRTEILDNIVRDWHQDQLQLKRIDWGQYIDCKSKDYVDCTC
ncbi:hypothetical protein SARC_10003 [Sphaeroforma arctica JP610]|uniref:Uncharacterized protein n=1 Tax=Sphaeroforma arctica JP610 TaxID=667725 RepID=A0A0L0FL97_9EUKA|nr:hypothetical protein SARC_10003 [Sphaeroforma arctica JP610]KNC77535.1 hypothetical protein SARC_10003 [Sphaeroforma arctica JP610]|eukprot:XP_014151437.1 hypothetical protein SARC_10003 [Sphaeroforma arctica JP610]